MPQNCTTIKKLIYAKKKMTQNAIFAIEKPKNTQHNWVCETAKNLLNLTKSTQILQSKDNSLNGYYNSESKAWTKIN